MKYKQIILFQPILGKIMCRRLSYTRTHLFEYDQHPMPAIRGCNQEILPWLPDEEECSLGNCKQQYINQTRQFQSSYNRGGKKIGLIITHIRRLKHRQELHCLTRCVHIAAVVDGLLNAMAQLPYHL